MIETSFSRLLVWAFYYLGITDGISASLEILKTTNRGPMNDAPWRIELRSYLPEELAALRQPNAPLEPVARIIEQEFRRARNKKKGQMNKKARPC